MDNNIDKKKQRKREILGLVVFCLAICGIFAAVVAYMIVGHSFDLAASGIDSNVGQLNGYCSIVFDGNNNPQNMKSTKGSGIQSLAEDILNPSKDSSQKDASTVPATTKNVSELYKSKDACVVNIKSNDYSAYSKGQIFEREKWRIGVLSIDEATLTDALASKKAQIDKEEAQAKDSQNKDSSSSNNSANSDKNLDASSEKSVTSKSVKEATPQMKALQSYITNLRKQNKADLIVVIAPNQDVLDVVSGVDCVIAGKVKSDVGIEGKQINSTYVIPEPVCGSVSCVLSTPAKMLSGYNYTKLSL